MEGPDRQELFDYYNERAPEYEDFYWGDTFPKLFGPDIYKKDTRAIRELVPDYVKGKCMDIACGTGFWLPLYEKNCPEITLIDQSENVLDECRKKIDSLGIGDKTELVRGELFGYPYRENTYDTALLGFLISHLTDSDLDNLMNIVSKAIAPGGRVIIIDSIWSEELLKGGREKEGTTQRILKDGRDFEIYKRYFERDDLESLIRNNKMQLEIVYWGQIFFMACATLTCF